MRGAARRMIEEIVAPDDRGVISITGAGGKTSLMFHLAKQLAATGRRVLTTTTTKIFMPDQRQSEIVVIEPDPATALARAVSSGSGHVTAVAGLMPETGKLKGYMPDAILYFQESGAFDWIIVEADGAARRPLKAPAAHEPVLPLNTTVHIAVAGLDAIGRPLTDEIVFRSETAGKLMNINQGAEITPSALALLLAHPEGAFKASPPHSRRLIFLNKADDEARRAAGLSIAREIERKTVNLPETVIIGQARCGVEIHDVYLFRTVNATACPNIAGVILAAGCSSRMGRTKQLLPYRGKAIIEWVVDNALASKLREVIVVTGHDAAAVERALDGRNVRIVRNHDYAAGQSTSLKAGIGPLAGQADAVLFMLGDQPLIAPETINRIIASYNPSAGAVFVPTHRGRRGNPVLLDRKMFPAIETLRDDCGARSLFETEPDNVIFVPVDEPSIHFDIDTEDDYRRLLQRSSAAIELCGQKDAV